MIITLRCWIGDYEPGEVLDVEPRLGALLVGNRFAELAAGEGMPVEPPAKAPTIDELRSYATARGVSTGEAKRLWREEYDEAMRGAARCT